MTALAPPEKVSVSGLVYAALSYLLWGFLPVAFLAVSSSGPIEIVAWRIVLSLVFCALLITVMRGWARLIAIARNRAAVLTLSVAAVLILVNWVVYVYASVSGHVVEASLGYFANPIVTVLLGVIVLRERLRVMQWIAIGVSAVAVIVIAIGYGQFPWISVLLALSFGGYGLVKKRVGGAVDALSGLAIETAILAPLAAGALVVVAATTGLTLGAFGPLYLALMLSLGVITAVPLLLFAAAARRIPLTYLGLFQYLAPILQLLVGVVIAREAMPPERWLGFGIVWVALAILTTDMFMHSSRQRGTVVVEAPGAP